MRAWYGVCVLSARRKEARRWAFDADEALGGVACLAMSPDAAHRLIAETAQSFGLEVLSVTTMKRVEHFSDDPEIPEVAFALADRLSIATPVLFDKLREIEPEVPETRSSDQITLAPTPDSLDFSETDWEQAFAPEATPLWAVVDGVNCREIADKVQNGDVQAACLYVTANSNAKAMAPWLVRLEHDCPVARWLLKRPHDSHWGFAFQSRATLRQLRDHLRRFTMIRTPQNDQALVYFRFYDPRVLVDLIQALDEENTQRLIRPFEAVYVPISPLHVLPEGLSLRDELPVDADAELCRNRLLRVTRTQNITPDASRGIFSFVVSLAEFERLAVLQKLRSNRKIARTLLKIYSGRTVGSVVSAVDHAGVLGRHHAMTSVKQVTTLAKCIVEFGSTFPTQLHEAQDILDQHNVEAWRKRDLLEAWLPKGRVRYRLLFGEQQPDRIDERAS